MKSILIFSSVLLTLALGHATYYINSTSNLNIAKRAFTIGDWDSCNSVSSTYDNYMSNLSYAYILASHDFEAYVGADPSLIKAALYVAKCQVHQEGYELDTQRVTRGISLGLMRNENINLVSGGQTALHLAVTTGNPALVKFILENGGNPSITTTNSYVGGSGKTAYDVAITLGELTPSEAMNSIINLLKTYE
ncbi:ankyrin repeat domain-containing protein [Thalassotalea mangrovi]|uniref:Ankyrin repeat domain-containing protein n=1 Tax=Thalassotalea mangrovi TaxID=2572245 RepID=A0A4U1B209_9GAMM|nr:ankyrin repeat domain-containing protein [Thalassotalea mangrovi]TKB43557.1 ankyrin repeat domain-containing protein [Thalassotalea mangrovi]